MAALPLRTGAKVRRGLVPLEAQTQAGAAVSTSSEGAAWSDYFYLDAPPHEAQEETLDLLWRDGEGCASHACGSNPALMQRLLSAFVDRCSCVLLPPRRARAPAGAALRAVVPLWAP